MVPYMFVKAQWQYVIATFQSTLKIVHSDITITPLLNVSFYTSCSKNVRKFGASGPHLLQLKGLLFRCHSQENLLQMNRVLTVKKFGIAEQLRDILCSFYIPQDLHKRRDCSVPSFTLRAARCQSRNNRKIDQERFRKGVIHQGVTLLNWFRLPR